MVESKKLLKIRNPKIELEKVIKIGKKFNEKSTLIAWTNFKFEKKRCISYSRSRSQPLVQPLTLSFFSKVYFIHS